MGELRLAFPWRICAKHSAHGAKGTFMGCLNRSPFPSHIALYCRKSAVWREEAWESRAAPQFQQIQMEIMNCSKMEITRSVLGVYGRRLTDKRTVKCVL